MGRNDDAIEITTDVECPECGIKNTMDYSNEIRTICKNCGCIIYEI